jgi:hypothetical protein
MTKYFIHLGFLMTASFVFSQGGFPNYWKMVALDAKADSLYKAKDFKNAAHYYAATANIVAEKAISMTYSDIHYNAACSWALANIPDSAFDELNLIAYKMNYSNYKHLIADADLNSLHSDKRWKPICDLIKTNEEARELKEKNYNERTTYLGTSKEIIFYPHTGEMRKFIDNDSLPFLSVDYSNFRIYFRGNSYAAKHLTSIKMKTDSALKRILTIADTSEYRKGLNLVFVDSAGELKELTGMYVHGGFSLQQNDEIFFVCNADSNMGLTHEIFHFISNEVWAHNTKSRLLNEGGAVYAEATKTCYYGNPIYGICAYLNKEKKLFPFNELINSFHDKEIENEIFAYYESAGIFKYLYEKYGIAKMKQLWLKGFDSFQAIYGRSLSQFEMEWTDFISTIQAPKSIDWDLLTKNGCG